ncbi:hypothetical protein [Burkholderia cepacia]|uniref:hypothetical protein n=1 Tax=Burkholderia cepacia TaxID=292 RepID=UPI001F2B19F7|nr:hypothetical protein [Burkholderia cepacia]UIY58082.1 hypothetical protein LZ568_07665 [Burkholderia cepacia]
MKKVIAVLLSLIASISFGATLLPVQLLNPTGSTSGQAIISTGPSSAPAWAAINAATLNGATFAAPGNIGFTTPGTGSFTTLNSTSGSLNGSIGQTTPFAGSFTTLSATGLITPSSTIGIKGTTTNDNAQAGSIGEYATATATSANLTSGTSATVTSVSLTAGDWDVSGTCQWSPGGATITVLQLGISNTAATLAGLGSAMTLFGSWTSGNVLSTPVVRFSIASTTTAYLVTNATFSGGTGTTCQGVIRARRVR